MRSLRILIAVGMVSFSVALLSYGVYYFVRFEPPESRHPSGTGASREEPDRGSEGLLERALAITALAEGQFSARSVGRRIYVDIPNQSLFFDSDSYALRPGIEIGLQALVSQLGNYTHLLVSGHADSSGDWLYNHRLSKQRAEAVASALMDLGVEGEDITPLGFGEAEPAESNETEEGRSLNRRVQIGAIYGSEPEPVKQALPADDDSCKDAVTWQEGLACFLRSSLWILVATFAGTIVTLVGGMTSLVKSLSR